MKDFMNYDFNINRVIIACFVPSGTGSSIHKNRQSHGLAIHMGGEKVYNFSDGKKLTVKKNDIIYLPKHSDYTVSTNVCGDCYAINFDISENIAFPPFVVKAKNHNEITDHFRIANKTWEAKRNSYIIKCKAELYNIIYAMQQEYFSKYFPKNKHELINPAVDFIHEKYLTQTLSIELLSTMCNITPEYFRKIFKSFYGISPVKYINNLKISHAKELLESNIFSVTEVAVQSGYSDASHFSREFKKAVGVAPSEYR